jgi:hypothetical protein
MNIAGPTLDFKAVHCGCQADLLHAASVINSGYSGLTFAEVP